MVARINISIPEDMKMKIDEYNTENPYDQIIVSRVAQAALHNKLVNVGKA